MDLVTDFDDPGGTTLMGLLGAAVGAIEVGEHLPSLHGDAELVMRQLGGVVDHHIGHVHQLCSAPGLANARPNSWAWATPISPPNTASRNRSQLAIKLAVRIRSRHSPSDQRPNARHQPFTLLWPSLRCTPRSLTAPITAASAPSVRRRNCSRRWNNSASSRPSRPCKVSMIDQLVDLERHHTHLQLSDL